MSAKTKQWHVQIEARDKQFNTPPFIQHYFVAGMSKQEAARNARTEFTNDYGDVPGIAYERLVSVEPDQGALIL
jgi:hypothetical protein